MSLVDDRGLPFVDVTLSQYEADALMAELLVSKAAPGGQRRFGDWLRENASEIGKRYATEGRRSYR